MDADAIGCASAWQLPTASLRDRWSPVAGGTDRTLIITGISRSGTSLLTVLLDELPDVVCFNEVLPMEIPALLAELPEIRRRLLAREPVPNKFDVMGRLATDTLQGNVIRAERAVTKALDTGMVVGSKRNLPYLNRLDDILAAGLPVVAMIRDPVATIASWGSEPARRGRIPGALIDPGETHPHWSPVRFTRTETLERRAEAWQHYAALLWRHRESVRLISYERLCRAPALVVAETAFLLGVRDGPGSRVEVRRAPRFDGVPGNVSQIRRAVERFCPIRREFGYE